MAQLKDVLVCKDVRTIFFMLSVELSDLIWWEPKLNVDDLFTNNKNNNKEYEWDLQNHIGK